MIVKEELLSKLRRYFDLNLYEVKLWTALLSRGVSTAGELSDIADVPRSRSYDVLESLEKKGFVIMKLGKPIKYIAIPPLEVVDRVKKNMHSNAQDKIKRLDGIRESPLMGELDSLHTNGISLVEPSEMSGCLRGRSNLYNHLDLLIKNAKKSVNIVTSDQGFMRKAEGLRPSLERAKKRGVKIRISAPLTKENKKVADSLKAIAEIKHNDKIKSRFVTVDSNDMVFMTMDDKEVHPSYDLGVWVKTPYFTSAMDQMFNTAWGQK
ncbi:TrmB family transcriptional regulator [Candidatus Woesearchaeota archaeon]|jgi:HTH-type transcriptional regulator, sugar sensing transcriptional regulator|nr:TrmB family transcriptional regulator [Candidatus Woesearchaeota archaeon]MBT5397307.1 TrmB family transcriptional regulator [Candidatus Woesearchaeota archaeon]MBT5924450.1 TrmB family transcriptional regulator [Candidatus Woesearchaeota archaeon]MBT6367848.1 TrmB family transcriptional regulator [Candidatus Woesearchaeota archaeon]MBT7762707.1 TrmB family transcriptional regulator [Candidatus Woesearchaeota archaeon]